MKFRVSAWLLLLLMLLPRMALADPVRVKDLGRFFGWRDNPLVGYGVVTGLAGSGDSPRSDVTRMALKNVLGRLGANVTPDQLQSRNVAAVIVAATLPPSANVGDRIDVTVTSIGDARSLMGGTLLMTPLMGPDQRPYALAQGSLVVGGYRFEANFNSQQKNYPTTGVVPGGATVENGVEVQLTNGARELVFILKDPDFTTAERIADGINAAGLATASVRGADAVAIQPLEGGANVYRLIARIEGIAVDPDLQARVVVNERTGTVVAGAGVKISSVVISQGDIKVTVSTQNQASQPAYAGEGYPQLEGGFPQLQGGLPQLGGMVISNTKLDVSGSTNDAVATFPSTTVADLAQGLSKLHVDTRGVIAILQAMKAAGALHADVVVQ